MCCRSSLPGPSSSPLPWPAVGRGLILLWGPLCCGLPPRRWHTRERDWSPPLPAPSGAALGVLFSGSLRWPQAAWLKRKGSGRALARELHPLVATPVAPHSFMARPSQCLCPHPAPWGLRTRVPHVHQSLAQKTQQGGPGSAPRPGSAQPRRQEGSLQSPTPGPLSVPLGTRLPLLRVCRTWLLSGTHTWSFSAGPLREGRPQPPSLSASQGSACGWPGGLV